LADLNQPTALLPRERGRQFADLSARSQGQLTTLGGERRKMG